MPNDKDSKLSPRIHVLIPCGGSGTRAGGGVAKQYQPIAGKPLVWHTLRAFAPLLESGELASVTVVIAAQDAAWQTVPPLQLNIKSVPLAGATRALTVTNGLSHLLKSHIAELQDWVLVHDAARCLITAADIKKLIAACMNDDVGGLLALPLADTMKQANSAGRVQTTVSREDKWLAQTPQMFRAERLLHALIASGDAVTDEASAMEQAGHAPLLVRGALANIKVTYPQDFAFAESLIKGRLE